MKTRKLGTIEVSEIGVGCMGFSHGYGAIPPEEESIAAIRAAYDAGCTFFDTAEVYGAQLYSPGHNERLLGKAVGGFRDKVVLATKFRFGADHPATAGEAEAFIRAHLAESMRNLRTDVVDLYYLQRGVVAIPRSSNPAHIAENLAVLDFELTPAEMAIVSGLDKNRRNFHKNDPESFPW